MEPFAVAPSGTGVSVGLPGAVPRAVLVLPYDEAVAVWSDYEVRKRTGDAAGWDLIDIRAGIAHVNAQTSETFLPQMLDYDKSGAISFTKGVISVRKSCAHAASRQTKTPPASPELERYGRTRPGAAFYDLIRLGPVRWWLSRRQGPHGEALAVLNDDVSGVLPRPTSPIRSLNSELRIEFLNARKIERTRIVLAFQQPIQVAREGAHRNRGIRQVSGIHRKAEILDHQIHEKPTAIAA
jgi:hypothetical protein